MRNPLDLIPSKNRRTTRSSGPFANGETPDSIRNNPALKGLDIPNTGQPGYDTGTLVTKTLVIQGDTQITTTASHSRGAMLRAYDKATGKVSTGIEEFLILEQALSRLAEAEPRLAQVVELHYFGGLNGPEISELLGVPVWSVTRDHRLAEAWLRRELSQS
jgi:hypothetical protein